MTGGDRRREEEGRRGAKRKWSGERRGERREDKEKMKIEMCGCGFEFPSFFLFIIARLSNNF